MILGSPFYIREEGETSEFKEFCLDTTSCRNIYNETDIIDIIKNGIISSKLSNLIEKNFYQYLDKYIPKYYSCFCNSDLKGKLILGVNDCAEITGIPFSDKMSKKTIMNYIKKNTLKLIKGAKNINDFKIKIIKLKKDNSLIYNSQCDKDLNNYIKTRDERKKIFENYNKIYKKWHDELEVKSGKLINILNIDKDGLINYIKKNNGPFHIINYLINNNSFIIPRGTIMMNRKTDINDYIYWLVKYKDLCTQEVINRKPMKPYYRLTIDPYIILDRLSDLRYKFINNNKINYYLIIININGTNKKTTMQFYNKNKFIIRKRVGSSCI